METNTGSDRPRILVLEDQAERITILSSRLGKKYRLSFARNVFLADKLVLNSLRSGDKFSVAITDLWVGPQQDPCADFARRLVEVIKDVNVILVADYDRKAMLSFPADQVLMKPKLGPSGLSKTGQVEFDTLESVVGEMVAPVRTTNSRNDLLANEWRASGRMRNISALKLFTRTITGARQGRRVEKITSMATDGRFLTTVVYPAHKGDSRGAPISLQSLLGGCPIGCVFCQNSFRRRFKWEALRTVTSEEIVSQVYLAMSCKSIRAAFRDKDEAGIVVNFAGPGDSLVFNLGNTATAITRLVGVNKPRISFIITTVGEQSKLREYLKEYVWLPRVEFYWSVNSLDPHTRELLMPGTRGQSLAKMRNLFRRISQETGKTVTASFVLFHLLNDGQDEVDRIAEFFGPYKEFKFKIMAACPGSIPDLSELETTSEHVESFLAKLKAAGLGDRTRYRHVYGSSPAEDSGCGRTRPPMDIVIDP